MAGDMFPTLRPRHVTLAHKVSELERELKTRKRLYPRWVENNKLNRVTADLRITILQAVLNDYYREGQTNDRTKTTQGAEHCR